jgi:hypothetical protein
MKEFTPGFKELAGMKANIRQLPAFAERFINPPIGVGDEIRRSNKYD